MTKHTPEPCPFLCGDPPGINPAAIQGLLSFAVAMAEDSPDACVRNAARKIVTKAKPDWRPRPGAKAKEIER